MPVYHFCAKKQIDNNTTNYYDGIVTATLPITTSEDYDTLKNDIAGRMNGAENGNEVILTSLSLVE